MSKQDRVITVYEQARGDNDDWPPNDTPGFFAWFSGKFDKVPIEYRDAIQVEISTDLSEWSQPEISITYKRKETDKELEERLLAENHLCSRQEKKERRVLAALLAKYGER